MDSFESLLKESYTTLEHFVKFKIYSRQDAEDIIQNVCLSACCKFSTLKDPAVFKSWLLSIARNKCNDYFREKARSLDIPLDALAETALVTGRYGPAERSVVRETLDLLGSRDKQILYLYYFKELPQDEIARRLNIPNGTVKSRLHYARKNFKEKYPHTDISKGGITVKSVPKKNILPVSMPAYTIKKINLAPFFVRWEEIMGWFLIPRLGEKITWGIYDFPERACTAVTEMSVVGKAEVHGIEGVEIHSKECEYSAQDTGRKSPLQITERQFTAQLTDTHCRLLSESHTVNGIKKYFTFLDGGAFLDNWGFGEDNCGNEVNLVPKGDILRDGDRITTADKTFLLDVVGRYEVTINGKTWDTICIIDCGAYNDGVLSIQYTDRNGRTVLWRRFNKNDWGFDRRHKLWTEILPENERITVNGETYVHWYDCISDYIF